LKRQLVRWNTWKIKFWKFEGNWCVPHCGTSHPRHETIGKSQIATIV
jgi:hypothetical protein